MRDEFTCRAEITYRGETLALNRLVVDVDLEDIVPSKAMASAPWEMHDQMQRQERRRRFVDMLSSQFAQALTEAMYKVLQEGAA